MPYSDSQSEEGSSTMPDFGGNVDMNAFSQILEMDEDEAEHEFSKPLVLNFFEQAEDTFIKMDRALAEKNLDELSGLGHFLKGSSATLGFNLVRDSCQVIQQYGHKLRLDGTPEPSEAVCLDKCGEALQKAKVDLNEVKNQMMTFFNVSETNGT